MSDNLDQAKQKVLEENTAQAVFKSLKSLENERGRFRTRWAWELLQNARDSAKPEGVEVAFLIHRGQLIFRHTDKSFTKDNIVHLIYHGSSKVNEVDPVGHFGTGFISTHLISKVVQVRGSLDGAQSFDFTLDRRGESPKELHASMENSWAAFTQSLQPERITLADGFSTEYIYEVGDGSINEMVDAGLEELRRNAGFMLAFNDALRVLHLEFDGDRTVFQKINAGDEGKHCSYTRVEERDGEGNVVDVFEVATASDGEVTAAVPLKQDTNGRILTMTGQIPRLYVAFPLLGTEEFTLPCVINSTQFVPTEDRDGIFLGSDESKDIAENRKLIKKGLEQASVLLMSAESEGWGDCYRLVAIGSIAPANWLDRDWYKSVLISEFLPVIRASVILSTPSGNRISPSTSWIPIGQGTVTPDEIWDLANGLKEAQKHLPIKAEVDHWSGNLSGWAALVDQKTESLDEAFGISRLTRLVTELSDIAQLTTALGNELDAFQWLKNLYRLLFEANQTDLFDEQTILPDQKGKFRCRNKLRLDRRSAEHADDPIDSALKDISEGLGACVRGRLLDRRIDVEGIVGLLQPLYQDELISELAGLVREQAEQGENESVSEGVIQSNIGFFAWALRHKVWKVIEGYPVLTRVSADNATDWRTLTLLGGKQENRLLAPPAHWEKVARDFVDLFPEKFVIADTYYESCPEPECWDNLANRGYVFAGPIFQTEEKIRDFLPDEPLPDTDDDESMRSSGPVEVSKIAFLTTEDVGILHTVRSSKRKAVRFLEFLTHTALEVDQHALEISEVACENGEMHKYFKANWLGPIKRRKWVPIAKGKQDHISPVSLGLLIKDFPDLMAALTEGRPALLMQALGVSLSALSLQALADEEDDRVALIKSLAVISDATGGNIAKVEELARELKEDPELLVKIEQSREKRKQVAENQRIGALVEKIFKEMLEDKGFVIERTGIGSDYSVESDVIEDGEETGLSIQGHGKVFLVEIKATRGDAVRMTSTQMKTAVENTDKFVVCFVRLQDSSPDRESVENQSRFILDIGNKVEGLWEGLSNLREAKTRCATRSEEGDLTLEIDELGIHLRIGKDEWDAGKPLAEVVTFFSGAE